MGDYTGLRFTAPLNELGRQAANLMTKTSIPLDEHRLSAWASRTGWPDWELVQSTIPKLNLHEFLKYPRNYFVPRGGLQGQPQDWVWTNKYDPDAGIWTVCCSFKDTPEQEMAHCFIYSVLKFLVSEGVYVEVRSPGALESDYFFIDGTPFGRGMPFRD